MTVLVTGGAGYIGSHTVHALVDAGERVVVLDNLSTGFASALPKHMLPIVGDVGDQALVAALIDEHGVESIIHFAGSTIVPESMKDPLGYYGNNTANSRALIEAAVKGGVRHFIFSSTAAVYGNPVRVPVAEDDPTVPLSPYGWSKLMTEIMLRDAGAAHGLGHVALALLQRRGRRSETAHRACRRPAPRISSRSRSKPRSAGAPRSTCSAPTIRPPDGTCIRDFIHVSDLARAHLAALDYLRVGRREHDAELRLRPRLFGARGAGRGPPRGRARLSGELRRAAARRHRGVGRRREPHPRDCCDWTPELDDLDTIVAPRARLGTPSDGQPDAIPSARRFRPDLPTRSEPADLA